MILGITGCPGSGKSTLARAVARHGWELIDADQLGRDIVENGPAILEKLASVFGKDIIGQSGRLNRRLLAQRAFADAGSTDKLNGIVHPALVERLRNEISRQLDWGIKTVVDCALIFEWDIQSEFDYVVTVHADEELRVRRIAERDGRPDRAIRGIMTAQLPELEKIRRADIALRNDGEIGQLEIFACMLATLSG